MQDFKKLAVWRRAHELTLAVYVATKVFPRDESYGLTSQIRRAASSIGANIAEGCGRDSNLDMARFLQTAFGSASELEYHLLLAHDLLYLPEEAYQKLSYEAVGVKRMLSALLKRLRLPITATVPD